MNWTNPKRLAAIVFFLMALGLLVLPLVTGMATGACTETEKAANPAQCKNMDWNRFGAAGAGAAVCCVPAAFIAFVIGAFVWSGAKKDELRDLEIEEKKRALERKKKG